LKKTVAICGSGAEHEVSEEEKRDLRSLQRGVYVKEKIGKGEEIKPETVYFAMPFLEGQLSSGKWKSGLVADHDYDADEPLSQNLRPDTRTKKDIVYSTIHMVKGMINNASIPLSHDFYVEISHHYGLENFYEVGCVIIESAWWGFHPTTRSEVCFCRFDVGLLFHQRLRKDRAVLNRR